MTWTSTNSNQQRC